uniref:Uncharacterized protein n=1 Tax=Knipowitschia caucasica TaxID=637954 RepID=A0AAV2MKU8_KNICA
MAIKKSLGGPGRVPSLVVPLGVSLACYLVSLSWAAWSLLSPPPWVSASRTASPPGRLGEMLLGPLPLCGVPSLRPLDPGGVPPRLVWCLPPSSSGVFHRPRRIWSLSSPAVTPLTYDLAPSPRSSLPSPSPCLSPHQASPWSRVSSLFAAFAFSHRSSPRSLLGHLAHLAPSLAGLLLPLTLSLTAVLRPLTWFSLLSPHPLHLAHPSLSDLSSRLCLCLASRPGSSAPSLSSLLSLPAPQSLASRSPSTVLPLPPPPPISLSPPPLTLTLSLPTSRSPLSSLLCPLPSLSPVLAPPFWWSLLSSSPSGPSVSPLRSLSLPLTPLSSLLSLSSLRLSYISLLVSSSPLSSLSPLSYSSHRSLSLPSSSKSPVPPLVH